MSMAWKVDQKLTLPIFLLGWFFLLPFVSHSFPFNHIFFFSILFPTFSCSTSLFHCYYSLGVLLNGDEPYTTRTLLSLLFHPPGLDAELEPCLLLRLDLTLL